MNSWAALFMILTVGAGPDEGPTLYKDDTPAYEQCFNDMTGHGARNLGIRVCHVGNGSYRDHKNVIEAISGKDWFPVKDYSGLIGEVRVVCVTDPEAKLPSQIVFPSKDEQGGRARLEIPCRFSAERVRSTLTAAQKLLRMIARERELTAHKATIVALPSCKSTPKSDGCARYQKLVRDTLMGVGSETINGRPFSFKLRGFEFRAGLRAASDMKPDADLESADPAVRLRALVKNRNKLESKLIMTETAAAFAKMSGEARASLIDQAVDDPDPEIRVFGLDHLETLAEERQKSVVNRALDDSNPDVRTHVIRYVSKLGEFFMVRAMRDPDHRIRLQALDTIIDHYGETSTKTGVMKYIEMGLQDQEDDIREFAQNKLNYLRMNEADADQSRVPASAGGN